jgi:hypothetical protein
MLAVAIMRLYHRLFRWRWIRFVFALLVKLTGTREDPTFSLTAEISLAARALSASVKPTRPLPLKHQKSL